MADDIYTYLEENFNIKVTDYQFKRDYIKNPLKTYRNHFQNEKPYLEDLIYLYKDLNLTSNEIGKIINKGENWASTYCKKNGICKTMQERVASQENSYFRQYGKKNPFSGKDGYIMAMTKFKEKYGYTNPLACPKFRNKQVQTLIKHYNIDNPRYIPHLLKSYQNKEFVINMSKKIFN